ncbi:MAG: hypothetical protein V5B36_04555 [Candidatus Accumulibacter sp. UW25]
MKPIAAGTMMAAELSSQLGWIGRENSARSSACFSVRACRCGPNLAVERYLDLMQHDKKVQDGKLRFVLLQRLGQAVVTDEAPLAEVRRAIGALRACLSSLPTP